MGVAAKAVDITGDNSERMGARSSRSLYIAPMTVGIGLIVHGQEIQTTDTPRLIRLRKARSVGVIPSIRRKVRVKCAASENPAP
jgi:hypothetical protein